MNTNLALKLDAQKDSIIQLPLLTGYWSHDVWDVREEEFGRFVEEKNYHGPNKTIRFDMWPEPLRTEVKYCMSQQLIKGIWTMRTVFNYSYIFTKLTDFLNIHYPKMKSIIEFDYDKMFPVWIEYLTDRGLKVYQKNGYLRTLYSGFINQYYNFYKDYYDPRPETEKDVWDCTKIPGARCPKHRTGSTIDFTEIPDVFKDIAKRYIVFRIAKNTVSQCRTDVMAIKLFTNNIHEQEPEWTTLNGLTRKHMEKFLLWFAGYCKNIKYQHNAYLIALRKFLEHIVRAEYPEAPHVSPTRLIFSEDIPKIAKYQDGIKYIPEDVLQQFDRNIEFIEPKEYIPVAIVLRASGWRIADVLNLKYDTCLEQTSNGWYLQGDIEKTLVYGHRIPITDEVALSIKVIAEEMKSVSNEENNPQHYLFARLRGKRMGKPYLAGNISVAFNNLSKERNIVDMNGQVFRIKNHAFRHTKAVELINNGMNVIHVQKWMAHASPEMTMRYAKILDDTLRKSWEETMKGGMFRIDDTGTPVPFDPEKAVDEDLIEWEYIKSNLDAVRMPLGYCMKPKKQECHTQLNPCLTCRNLCTTAEFIPQYETEIRETKAIIETGKRLGRTTWVEKNETLLKKYEDVLAVLKTGKTHHLAGKEGREYVGEQRKNTNENT